jgi:hypothetical protein
MSLQFSYKYAIFISVCNSHLTTPALTYEALHGFYVTMTLNSLTLRQPRFSVEDYHKLELIKIYFYLLFKSSEVKSLNVMFPLIFKNNMLKFDDFSSVPEATGGEMALKRETLR